MPDGGDLEGILRRKGEQGKDRAPRRERSVETRRIRRDPPRGRKGNSQSPATDRGPAPARLSPPHTVEILLVTESAARVVVTPSSVLIFTVQTVYLLEAVPCF